MKRNVIIFIIGILVVILILGIYALNLFFGTFKENPKNAIASVVNSKAFSDKINEIKIKVGKSLDNSNKPTKNNTKPPINLKDNKHLYAYNSRGKRDPFVRYDASNNNSKDEKVDKDATPLEKFDISKLKLTAIISSGDIPKAVIEDADGKGFFVEKGANIGLNNGVITDILQDKIIITETQIDFTGQKKVRTIEMKLRK